MSCSARLLDASVRYLAESGAAYWLRRAEQFESAKPTLSDFRGQSAAVELRAKWRELDAIARACRNRAVVSPLSLAEEVAEVLGEVAV